MIKKLGMDSETLKQMKKSSLSTKLGIDNEILEESEESPMACLYSTMIKWINKDVTDNQLLEVLEECCKQVRRWIKCDEERQRAK